MISIDTNVLVRSLIDDDDLQDRIARDFFAQACLTEGLFISSFVILETVWVLKTKKVARLAIVELIDILLNTPQIMISNSAIMRAALHMYKSGRADFCDYALLHDSLHHQISELKTFDQKFAKEAKQSMIVL
ncbi:MAG: type II toxin-antitoxin system VapC family toxin [Pseudomonadota bacterium]